MAASYYKTVKRYYDKGIYDNDDVALFVRAGRLTPEEYERITGEPYEEEEKAVEYSHLSTR